ncbi:MAG: fused MFS/spermidine synthase [Flavobacteriales bacterium]|nr:fused MFS/spermidine synthase [Flavobacteriales bacterium]
MEKIQSDKLSFKDNWFIFLVLLVEGGALMAVELVGAKLIAPYYGNSLYVWAAVLATTLGGLTLGYYTGGKLSLKHPNVKTLLKIISVSALLVLLMPMISGAVMSATLGLELRTGIVLSCLVFLMPPLMGFGMVGPMSVRLMTTTVENVGKVAGTVYFTSTVGGICTTFLFGFYLIPFWGLKMSAYLTGSALALLPIIFLVSSKFGKSAD